MERILLQQNRHWNNEKYPGLYKRNCLDSLIRKNAIKDIQVLLGVRRSGKSTIFKLMINHLMDEVPPQKILYINFDDPFFSPVYKNAKNIYNVVETAEKLIETKIDYLFLDEIQNVTGWEKYVKSVYDSEIFTKIFITGSNSSLLKSEYASLLSGRYLIEQIYPFSFNEVLKSAGIESYLSLIEKKAETLGLVDMLLEYGAYPEIIKCGDDTIKREIILNYYDTIILKDCIAQGNVRDIKTFKELTLYTLSNAAVLFSYNSVAKAIGSNDITVKDFLHLLENSFLINEIRTFSFSVKKQIKYKKKLYCVDNGFLANISFRFSSNRGKLLENLVFSELIKAGNKIFFYNDIHECDFITQKNNKFSAIQVCFELDEQNKKREFEGLEKTIKKLNLSKGTIITYNQEESTKNINVIPFWKFFCGYHEK